MKKKNDNHVDLQKGALSKPKIMLYSSVVLGLGASFLPIHNVYASSAARSDVTTPVTLSESRSSTAPTPVASSEPDTAVPAAPAVSPVPDAAVSSSEDSSDSTIAPVVSSEASASTAPTASPVLSEAVTETPSVPSESDTAEPAVPPVPDTVAPVSSPVPSAAIMASPVASNEIKEGVTVSYDKTSNKIVVQLDGSVNINENNKVIYLDSKGINVSKYLKDGKFYIDDVEVAEAVFESDYDINTQFKEFVDKQKNFENLSRQDIVDITSDVSKFIEDSRYKITFNEKTNNFNNRKLLIDVTVPNIEENGYNNYPKVPIYYNLTDKIKNDDEIQANLEKLKTFTHSLKYNSKNLLNFNVNNNVNFYPDNPIQNPGNLYDSKADIYDRWSGNNKYAKKDGIFESIASAVWGSKFRNTDGKNSTDAGHKNPAEYAPGSMVVTMKFNKDSIYDIKPELIGKKVQRTFTTTKKAKSYTEKYSPDGYWRETIMNKVDENDIRTIVYDVSFIKNEDGSSQITYVLADKQNYDVGDNSTLLTAKFINQDLLITPDKAKAYADMTKIHDFINGQRYVKTKPGLIHDEYTVSITPTGGETSTQNWANESYDLYLDPNFHLEAYGDHVKGSVVVSYVDKEGNKLQGMNDEVVVEDQVWSTPYSISPKTINGYKYSGVYPDSASLSGLVGKGRVKTSKKRY